MNKIISHLSPEYIKLNIPHNNGAYYYSLELYDNVVPKIKTNRNWVLINAEKQCYNHSIVIIHNNANPERYTWLSPFKDLILVCSQPKTIRKLIEMFPRTHIVYIPLSIDTKYVKQFKVKRKSRNYAYYGRKEKCPQDILEDDNIDKIFGNDRDECLKLVAKYKNVFAIGRCALEAKCLGCNVLSHAGEYENVDFKLLDNKEIIPELQRLINEIDGKE